MKTWQELAKEHDAALEALNILKGQLQEACSKSLREKYADFVVVPDYDIHGQNMPTVIANGREFNVGDYRCNDPELFGILPDYPEIEELLYIWSL